MYSVVEFMGHQYKVSPGDLIDVEKVGAEVGSIIELSKVLFVAGEKPLIGAPQVAGAKVLAKVIREDRDSKIIVFKRKRRSGRKVKQGHRQSFTALLITEISDGKGNTIKIDPTNKRAEKYLK